MISSWVRNKHMRTPARLFATLALVTALASSAAAQKVKLATLVPDGSLWDRGLKSMGARWREETGGKLSLRIYAGGVAGDETDMVRKMRIGQIHGGLFSASGLGAIEPAFKVFEIPLLFEDDAEVLYVLERMKEPLEKLLLDKGYVMVNWAHAGWMRIFATRPITSYADFIGMKQFVWGSGTAVAGWYEEKGIRTVPLGAPDILTGLQTGLVEVVPATPLTALSLQWFRSAPYMFERRLAPLIGGTIVSKKIWKKFPEGSRPGVLAAAREVGDSFFRDVPPKEDEALEAMKSRGLSVTSSAVPTDRKEWDGLAKHFQDRMRDDSVPKETFDQVMALLKEYRSRGPGD